MQITFELKYSIDFEMVRVPQPGLARHSVRVSVAQQIVRPGPLLVERRSGSDQSPDRLHAYLLLC